VLHLHHRFLLSRLGVSSSHLHRLACAAPPPLLDAGDVWGGVGLVWARKMVRETTIGVGVWTPVRPGASKPVLKKVWVMSLVH
jgi:hypothetical protein